MTFELIVANTAYLILCAKVKHFDVKILKLCFDCVDIRRGLLKGRWDRIILDIRWQVSSELRGTFLPKKERWRPFRMRTFPKSMLAPDCYRWFTFFFNFCLGYANTDLTTQANSGPNTNGCQVIRWFVKSISGDLGLMTIVPVLYYDCKVRFPRWKTRRIREGYRWNANPQENRERLDGAQ